MTSAKTFNESPFNKGVSAKKKQSGDIKPETHVHQDID